MEGTHLPGRRARPRIAMRRTTPSRCDVLVVDGGGTSAKLRATGAAEVRVVATGPRMTPGRLVRSILRRCADWQFDVVSLGHPGPVRGGRPGAGPWNLGRGWTRFDIARAFGRPFRVVNDAAMQALGACEGRRLLFLGIGTGLGTAMVVGGVPVPMELSHLPWRRNRTFEDEVGAAGLARLGATAWRRAVADVVAILSRALLPDDVVIGGGNVSRLDALPHGARRGSNDDAFNGGVAVWNSEEAACPARPGYR